MLAQRARCLRGHHRTFPAEFPPQDDFTLAVYGVSAYVDVVVGDYTKIWRRLKVRRASHCAALTTASVRHVSRVIRLISLVRRLISRGAMAQADVVLVSPPWGGPQYAEDPMLSM